MPLVAFKINFVVTDENVLCSSLALMLFCKFDSLVGIAFGNTLIEVSNKTEVAIM